MKVHPFAEMLPRIEGAEFDDLVSDIREHGQLTPVDIDPKGVLLDGRNRVRACGIAGVEVRTKVQDVKDQVAFIASRNLYRRHFKDGQRAMIAGKLATATGGQPRKEPVHMDGFPETTRAQAASLLSVAPQQVGRAHKVLRDGTPELQELASAGRVPVSTAARVAELPTKEQAKFVKKVQAGADPVKVAPVDGRARDRRLAAKGRGKTAPSVVVTEHLGMLDRMADTMLLWQNHLLGDLKVLDGSVDPESATRLDLSFSRSRLMLTRVIRLLEERAL